MMEKGEKAQASISSTHVLKGSIGYIPPSDRLLLEFSRNPNNEDVSISPENQYDCLTEIIEIGLSCARDSPDGCMSLRLALNSLKTAKHDLLKQSNMGIKGRFFN
ncbi:LOW QUALITY PROTEIN: hypothetical protein TorRG33x02_352420 [Trema orientale]|uniref:Uncharacterized protein n=1 Tax=Trema orientale TaxID=63057 RepID=A0A2P5AEK3_TREOI|nr:LOW QUALITY PROTEIN: hypothetical protein TorRG33x02_352420 [Trema orientale]